MANEHCGIGGFLREVMIPSVVSVALVKSDSSLLFLPCYVCIHLSLSLCKECNMIEDQVDGKRSFVMLCIILVSTHGTGLAGGWRHRTTFKSHL